MYIIDKSDKRYPLPGIGYIIVGSISFIITGSIITTGISVVGKFVPRHWLIIGGIAAFGFAVSPLCMIRLWLLSTNQSEGKERNLKRKSKMSGKIYHFAVIIEYITILITMEILSGGIRIIDNPAHKVNPWEKYGIIPTYIMYGLRCLVFFAIPFTLANIIGILSMNTYAKKPKLNESPTLRPFVCVRIVTRGDYPELVRYNAVSNLKTCLKVGMENFIVEVVTDKSIGINEYLDPRIKETVVAKDYKPRGGALFKAKALNYCLEEGIDTLEDDNWIVHVDEETLITESAAIGILNFIQEGDCHLGQGVITYANEEIVNWKTTLMDCVRVGVDYGMMRLTLGVFHRPIFSWKGSFVVVNAAVEKDVTFDHGPRGSIAEDCYFAMIAYKKGYKFGWIKGEMWEKSTFTLMDFMRQRKRWLQGQMLTLGSSEIPLRCKVGLAFNVFCNSTIPLGILNIVLPVLFPMPTHQAFDALCGVVMSGIIFLYIFGAQKSFSYKRLGLIKYVLRILNTLIMIPLVIICEGTGAIMAIASNKKSFHVVSKSTANENAKCTAISKV